MAEMAKGASSAWEKDMIWPVPPRQVLAPPESGRNSFCQQISGAIVAVTSTGVLRTPDGKAVALRPSMVGRAPMPPAWKQLTAKLADRFAPGASVPPTP